LLPGSAWANNIEMVFGSNPESLALRAVVEDSHVFFDIFDVAVQDIIPEKTPVRFAKRPFGIFVARKYFQHRSVVSF
jgi:hypothetical protein